MIRGSFLSLSPKPPVFGEEQAAKAVALQDLGEAALGCPAADADRAERLRGSSQELSAEESSETRCLSVLFDVFLFMFFSSYVIVYIGIWGG